MQTDYTNSIEEQDLKDKLEVPIKVDTELKQLIVNYIGSKLNPDGEEITLEQAIYLLCEEFPELVLPIAEENFIRGYNQAYLDLGIATRDEQTSGVHQEQ
jgi:hypothetical protein